MLVLIAGITGSLGQRLAKTAQDHGLHVRGLGRSPEKLPDTITQSLESFVQSSSHDDIPALDRAVAGVDSVICAYSPTDILSLDGCLLLLRAAERAGIKVFISSSWNNDWTRLKFGDFEHYDTCIAFENHVALTSSIRPVYIFTGDFSDLLITPYGPGAPTLTAEKAVFHYWDEEGLRKRQPWTTQDDAAVYTIDILLNGDGVQEGCGGFFTIASGRNTIVEIAEAYSRVTGIPHELECKGSLSDLAEAVAESRRRLGRSRSWEYAPLVTEFLVNTGAFEVPDDQLYNIVQVKAPTTLDDAMQALISSYPA
ncbi:NAD(P)-binding protein [Aaosphaeria arxii CBS 175.79]|uniref:NAD(P)-binding protein n=1 Tax=Aaosphaeria arxii CBS 175.79 TaxID=1450172 RepID=A0A6A5XF17_9PLEO|nr:NAD(P)-binding protein [Aaosphaeria arxii CBS 175.79]KAF2011835.1 NAD(P)-binding protein [Aaosphaeria arxii CBS 175.79]